MIKKILAVALIVAAPSAFAIGPISGGGSGTTFDGGTVSTTITETATAPYIATFGGGTSGVFNALLMKTNETAVPRPGQSSQVLADFSLTATYGAGSNGSPRRDNAIALGYNVGGATANDDQFFLQLENSYKTGASIRQGEFYFATVSGDGTLNTRPFGITPAYDLHTVDVAIRANTFEVGDGGNSNDWCQFQSSSSAGTLQLSGNSTIAYNGSNLTFITYGGNSVLGYDTTGSDTLRLGGSTKTFLLSPDGNGTADNITLNFGGTNTRGLRFDTAAGWQFQTDGSTWQAMGSPTNYNYTSQNTGIGPTAFTPNATFEVYDATATTGISKLKVRAGAGQSGNLFEVLANNDSTVLVKQDAGSLWTSYLRDLGNEFALQTGFDSTNVLMLASAKKISWSNSTHFYDTVDTQIERGGVGVVSLTSVAKLGAKTISTLPTGAAGMVGYITDGDSSLAWGATAVNSGAGATKYLVWYNGSNWTVMGK